MEAKMTTSKLMKHKGIVIGFSVAAIIWLLSSTSVQAQQQAQGPYLSPNQLEDLVAPIALYPDPLISQILVGSTYPLEIVEASQWLAKNPNLSGAALTNAALQQDWDPSIQALVPFPDVLTYLTEDIAWTTSLGNAFLAQESDVMDAIQRMRARAVQLGKLSPSPQEQIIRTYDSGQTIYTILPADPYVIYVPVYDPLWIWGPSVYYPYPRWYYSPHAPVLYYNRGISVNLFFGTAWQGWNNWGWRPAWTGHSVLVNNTFIYGHNLNARSYNTSVVNTRWSHDENHRQGVPYPNRELADRYHGRNGAASSFVSSSPRAVTAPSPSRNTVPAQDRVGIQRQNPSSPVSTREPDRQRNELRSNTPRRTDAPVPVQSRDPAPRPIQDTHAPAQRTNPPSTMNVPQLTTSSPVRSNLPNSTNPSLLNREARPQPGSVVTSRDPGPTQSQFRNSTPSRTVPTAREVAPSQYRDASPSRNVPSAREVAPAQSNTRRESSNSGDQSGHGSASRGDSHSGRR